LLRLTTLFDEKIAAVDDPILFDVQITIGKITLLSEKNLLLDAIIEFDPQTAVFDPKFAAAPEPALFDPQTDKFDPQTAVLDPKIA
jgi:hypothetical protein